MGVCELRNLDHFYKCYEHDFLSSSDFSSFCSDATIINQTLDRRSLCVDYGEQSKWLQIIVTLLIHYDGLMFKLYMGVPL